MSNNRLGPQFRPHLLKSLPESDLPEVSPQDSLNGLAERRGQTTIDTKSRTDVLNGPQYVEAMNWYRRAADQNEPKSMYAIGRFYERGLGVPINIDLAMKWYAKAAALGQSDAKVRLEIPGEQQHP